mgnify:CR=1 FL=1
MTSQKPYDRMYSESERSTMTRKHFVEIAKIVNNQPESTQALDARLCWLSEAPLNPATRYVLRHTTRDVQAKITEVLYRIDINTLHRVEDDVTIGVNDMARVRIKTASPLLTDGYKDNRSTGSFILVDPSTHLTVAAGVVG